MLYREIIAVCSRIHTKHVNALCGQNVEFFKRRRAVTLIKQDPVRATSVKSVYSRLQQFGSILVERNKTYYVGRCRDVMRDRCRCDCADAWKWRTHGRMYSVLWTHGIGTSRMTCGFVFVGATCTLGKRVVQLYEHDERDDWSSSTCWCCHLTTVYKFANKYYTRGDVAGDNEFFFACYFNASGKQMPCGNMHVLFFHGTTFSNSKGER